MSEVMPLLPTFSMTKEEGPECIGQVYRYIESFYRSKHGFVTSREIRHLKRASCPGCSKCAGSIDDLDYAVGEDDIHYIEYGPEIRSGDIIELKFVGHGLDFETGYHESWHRKAVHAQRFRITKEQSQATPEHLRIRVADAMKYLALPYEKALAKVLEKEAKR